MIRKNPPLRQWTFNGLCSLPQLKVMIFLTDKELWKDTNMKNISLFLSAIFLSQNVLGQATPSPQLQTQIESFDQLQSLLRTAGEGPAECTILNDENMPKNCSFTNFCSVISPNVNKPFLYVNAEGGKIPNYKMLAGDTASTNCIVQLRARENVGNFQEQMAGMTDAMKRVQQARVDLLKTVREQNWQADFVRFEEAAAQIGLEDAEKNVMTMPTEANATALIGKIETSSGVTLPPAIRTKYLASLTAMMPSQTRSNIVRMASNDPYQNLLLLFNRDAAGSEEAVKKNQQEIQNAVDRSVAIFEKTKTDIMKVLDQRAEANPDMAANVAAMKDRIRTIAFNLPPNNPMLMGAVCPGPNAFYNGSMHAFTLCPQVMELPESALKTIIAHELGHSIDPCTLSQPLMKVSDAVPRMPPMSPEQMSAAEQALNAQGMYLMNLNGPKPEAQYVVDFFGTAQGGLSQGFSNFRLESAGAAVALQDHPFNSVVNCLTTPQSINARASDKESVRTQLTSSLANVRATGAADTDPRVQQLQNTLANLDGLYTRIGACSFLPGNTQLQEAFSDWIAGEVVGNDLKNLPSEKRRQYAFESFSFFTGMDCSVSAPDSQPQVDQFLNAAGCAEGNNQTLRDINTIMMNAAQSDSHNHGVERVERLFTAQPQVRGALGCEGEGASHCE